MKAFQLLACVLILVCGPGNTASAQRTRFSGTRDSVAKLVWTRKPVGYVNDYDKLFRPDQRGQLEMLIKRFQDSNGYEICIVTLPAESGVKGGLDSLGTLIANSWGVGSKAFNDGLTIVICAACREMRITHGLGTAQILSDPKTKSIIDTGFLPAFKRNDYFDGVLTGLQILMAELRGKRPPPSF